MIVPRLRTWCLLLAGPGLLAPLSAWSVQRAPDRGRPNVLLIITDDQGYGDLGIHGNPAIRTPHLDRLARESVRFERFYVAPVCSPTRASLLTGRYNYRTGVVDTYLGRSLMHPDEATVAEMLASSGYRTAIFGKWHLGDNYPLRAVDQGFRESLTLNGGGIGQPSDPPGGDSYFDPMLRHNGRWTRTRGYISDVLADAAIDFIRRSRGEPFFAYLSFNAPHTPLQVPPEPYARYRATGMQPDLFRGPGHPVPASFNADTTARVYAMVENIDQNVGRVLAELDRLNLTRQTLVTFLTDNGPQQPRYNAGLPGLKGTVRDGGIRVPLFVRWPGRFEGGRTVDTIAAHIDIAPTLLEATRSPTPSAVRFDGRSLLPLLAADGSAPDDRTLFFQWHRGDVPEEGRAFAARNARFKLVQPLGNGDQPHPPDAPLLLFDMAADPFEQRDVAREHPGVVALLREAYRLWFRDVTIDRDYTDRGVPRIAVGAPQENPVRLTRQDWRGPQAGWTPASIGYWLVDVRRAGHYDLTVRSAPSPVAGTVTLSIGDGTTSRTLPAGAEAVVFRDVRLVPGPATLSVDVMRATGRAGALDVVVTRR